MKTRLGWTASIIMAASGLTAGMPTPARADAFTTFDLSGTFVSSPPNVVLNVPLSGTFTVDTTIGLVTTINLFNGQFGPSTIANQQTESPQYGSIYEVGVNTPENFVGLVFPVATLVGYAGGNLVGPNYSFQGVQLPGTTYFPNQYPGLGVALQTGMATAEAVPEPGSMGLLMTALGGLVLIAWRRSVRAM